MARNEQAITGVFDSGPIIHLDEIACLDLISDFKENILPDTVWREIDAYRPTALTKTHLGLVHLFDRTISPK